MCRSANRVIHMTETLLLIGLTALIMNPMSHLQVAVAAKSNPSWRGKMRK